MLTYPGRRGEMREKERDRRGRRGGEEEGSGRRGGKRTGREREGRRASGLSRREGSGDHNCLSELGLPG